MWRFVKSLLIPFTLAGALCGRAWNAMTDRGWNFYVRLCVAGFVFVVIAIIGMYGFGYI